MKYFTSRFTWLGSFLNVFHEKWELPAKSGMLLTFAVAGLLMTGAAADADIRTPPPVTTAQYSGYSNGMSANGGVATFIPDSRFTSLSPAEIDVAIDGPLLTDHTVTLYWTATYTDGSNATSGGTMFLTSAQMTAAGNSYPFEVFPFAYWQAAVSSGKVMKSFSVQAAGAPEATVIVAVHGVEFK
jgi:hypothetical protein